MRLLLASPACERNATRGARNDGSKVVQELIRHTSFGITMDIYAQAVTAKKRHAHSKVIEMVAASQRAAKANADKSHSSAAEGASE